jgi:hypothetical protein
MVNSIQKSNQKMKNMKKSIFLIVLLALTTWATAQDYTFKRCLYPSFGFIKSAGEVSIVGDTLISFTIGGVIAPYEVNIVINKPELKQFKTKQENSDFEQRFSLSIPIQKAGLKKDETGTLTLETKDNFTGKLETVTYYLIPK